MKSNKFSVAALPTAIVEEAKRKSTTGAPAHQIVTVESAGAIPCRHCLSWGRPGERMILFPYQSIPDDRPYAESGPVFVHAEECERYSAPNEFPAELRTGRVLRGYNAADEIIAAEVADGAPEELAERMLANLEVQFLHVRSASRGCYTFKLERA